MTAAIIHSVAVGFKVSIGTYTAERRMARRNSKRNHAPDETSPGMALQESKKRLMNHYDALIKENERNPQILPDHTILLYAYLTEWQYCGNQTIYWNVYRRTPVQ